MCVCLCINYQIKTLSFPTLIYTTFSQISTIITYNYKQVEIRQSDKRSSYSEVSLSKLGAHETPRTEKCISLDGAGAQISKLTLYPTFVVGNIILKILRRRQIAN